MDRNIISYELHHDVLSVNHPKVEWKRNVKSLCSKFGASVVEDACVFHSCTCRYITSEMIESYLAKKERDENQRCPYYIGATHDCCSICTRNGGCRSAFCSGYLKNCRYNNK